MSIEFAIFSDDEKAAVDLIVERAKNQGLDGLSTHMDLAATHLTCPLKLEELAQADDFNFFHDIYGIAGCLDRITGILQMNFEPRFAA